MWQGATDALLDRLALAPGMSCLDVGSGPGLVMRSMADRVGPQGHVTGLDIDGKLGAQALADLNAQGGAVFSLVEANVLGAETLAGAPFDLTYCRLFLMHMPNPVKVLEKMLAWTIPGGVVAAHEFDFGAIAVEPLCPAMSESTACSKVFFAAMSAICGPAQFEAAGIGPPDGTTADVKYVPLSDMAPMLIGVYQGLYASADELGIADPARAEAFRRDMTQAGADGRYFCLTPILIGAWKRVS